MLGLVGWGWCRCWGGVDGVEVGAGVGWLGVGVGAGVEWDPVGMNGW